MSEIPQLPPELEVFLEAHPDWEHVVFMRRHVLLQLVKVEPIDETGDRLFQDD